MRRRPDQRGVALVVVLWMALIVAAICGAFVLETRGAAQIARNVVDQSAARALADGFIDYVAFDLMKPNADQTLRRDGTVYDVGLDDGHVQFAVEDENGKIDVNRAPGDLLEGLFQAAGASNKQAVTLADAIVAWRRNSPESAENQISDIRLIRPPSRHRFHLVDEVQSIEGMPRHLFERARGAMTVHSSGSGIYFPTASRLALLAIPGISAEAVDTYLESRSNSDDSDHLSALNSFLDSGEARKFYLARRGGRMTILIHAQVASGAAFVRKAVVGLGGNTAKPVRIFEWRTGSVAEFERRTRAANVSTQ